MFANVSQCYGLPRGKKMTDSRSKFVSPSILETAFNCPHCGALAKQHWFSLYGDLKPKDSLPLRLTKETVNREYLEKIEDGEFRIAQEKLINKIVEGYPFIEREKKSSYLNFYIYNTDISQCYNCDRISIWIGSSLGWPLRGDAPQPNVDLPDDVRLDFEEAGRIVNISPRGAAALLRLSIQKLCGFLGEKGRNIDDDIAALVKKGLDVRIQRSLDIVRVIGNEAVHPGQIDLRDDVSTASKLFTLVNIIADAMITQPKQIEEMYGDLPEAKRKAIERRDEG